MKGNNLNYKYKHKHFCFLLHFHFFHLYFCQSNRLPDNSLGIHPRELNKLRNRTVSDQSVSHIHQNCFFHCTIVFVNIVSLKSLFPGPAWAQGRGGRALGGPLPPSFGPPGALPLRPPLHDRQRLHPHRKMRRRIRIFDW